MFSLCVVYITFKYDILNSGISSVIQKDLTM